MKIYSLDVFVLATESFYNMFLRLISHINSARKQNLDFNSLNNTEESDLLL